MFGATGISLTLISNEAIHHVALSKWFSIISKYFKGCKPPYGQPPSSRFHIVSVKLKKKFHAPTVAIFLCGRGEIRAALVSTFQRGYFSLVIFAGGLAQCQMFLSICLFVY